MGEHKEQGSGGEFRPDLLADPRNDHPDECKANAEERLKLAYAIQQKDVPDQMAMVWRRDLGHQRHRLIRQEALVDMYRRGEQRAEARALTAEAEVERLKGASERADRLANILTCRIGRGETITAEHIESGLEYVSEPSPVITDDDREWAATAVMETLSPPPPTPPDREPAP